MEANKAILNQSLLPSFQSIETERKKQKIKDSLDSFDYNKINEIYNEIRYHYTHDKKEQLSIYLHTLKTTLSGNKFHLKGKFEDCKNSLYKTQGYKTRHLHSFTDEIYFNCELSIKNEDKVYKVSLTRIRKPLHVSLQKLKKDTVIYITNVKSNINLEKENNFLTFITTIDTKIFTEISSIDDLNKPLISYKIDLTKEDEFEFLESLDETKIQTLIRKLSDELFYFSKYLNISIDNDVFKPISSGGKDFLHIDKKTVSICGLIKRISISDNNATIDLLSLVDSNVIKVFIFSCKALYSDLKKNMVVIFNNYNLKYNKYLDIQITNSMQSFNETIGLIKQEEVDQILKNKKYNILSSNNIPITSLLSLVSSNMFTRTISKYYITIKQIFKVTVSYYANNNKIRNFPNMRLKSKILIDDGTYEAIAFFNDIDVYRLFELTDEELAEINTKCDANNSNEENIYQRYRDSLEKPFLTSETLRKVFNRIFIIVGVPFSKEVKEIAYEHYFNRNQNEEQGVNKEEYCFINGEIYEDKSYGSANKYLAKRPLLRVLGVEAVDMN